MKRIINQIARYIIGVDMLILLLFLACMFSMEQNIIADRLMGVVLVLLMIGVLVFIITYAIHAFWMIRERKKISVTWICACVAGAAVFAVLEYYQGKGYITIIRGVACIVIAYATAQIGRYVHSWRENRE